MIDLFEAVTLTSLVCQSSSEFIWLIVIDAHMPSNARARMERFVRPYAHIHLVSIDLTALRHVRQGCFDWVWSACQEFILERGLVDDPYDYVTTSLIDADDAWHLDTIATVNRFIVGRLPLVCVGEESRGTWLRHTSGIAATFPRGYRWFIAEHALEPMDESFMSMSVFIAARFSSNISACSSRHRGWQSYCYILAFECCEMECSERMWVYARHGLSTQPWDARGAVRMDSPTSDVLPHDFGIDCRKIELWCEKYRPNRDSGAAAMHAGHEAASQYDLVFRIAALNRSIDAMHRRREREGEDETFRKGFEENEAKRLLLIDRLRAAG